MKTTKITLNNYTKLLSEIQKHIAQTQSNIVKSVTREKVVMAWQIGKIISEHLSKNKKSGYGEHLFKQLEKDILITSQVLYKMHSFYKAYPKLPADNSSLNWSHYRVLSGIKKTEERKYLEDLTKQNGWDTDRLQEEVSKSKTIAVSEKNKSSESSASKASKPSNKNSPTTKTLRPIRGKLFSYPIIKLDKQPNLKAKTYLDLGFKIFREVEEVLPKSLRVGDQIVDVVKQNESYSVKKSNLHPRKMNVYKAYLERVVDGDTIHVVLDLGFKIFHEEILRLRGINAAERDTAEGKKSAKVLNDVLKEIPFLVIKTSGNDMYGRYVADVFLAEPKKKKGIEIDPQKVADEGVYLNQLLMDKGSVVMV